MTIRHIYGIAILPVLLLAASSAGQSLYEQPQPAPVVQRGEEAPAVTDGTASLADVSLFVVLPPEPRVFAEQDLVTIIISERTRASRSQETSEEKSMDLEASVTSTVDLLELLELRLSQGRGPGDDLPTVSGGFEKDFEGEAEYERDDSVTARVTARVVEVKPNGTLLLEARTSVRTDNEEQVITLAGYCRSEDVTAFNTVQSNQMYDLNLSIENTGDVKDGSEKGLIPRVVDFLFNF